MHLLQSASHYSINRWRPLSRCFKFGVLVNALPWGIKNQFYPGWCLLEETFFFDSAVSSLHSHVSRLPICSLQNISDQLFFTLLRGFLTLSKGAKTVPHPHMWFTSTGVHLMLCTAEMVWPLTREDQQLGPEMCPEAKKSCTNTHFALSLYKPFLLFTRIDLFLIFPTWNRKVRSKLESADTGNTARKNKPASMSITEITIREDTNSLKCLDRWGWWDSQQNTPDC